MLKKIKYETHKIEDVILDLADEIKNGWKIHSFGWPCVEMSCCQNPDIAVEVTLKKEF